MLSFALLMSILQTILTVLMHIRTLYRSFLPLLWILFIVTSVFTFHWFVTSVSALELFWSSCLLLSSICLWVFRFRYYKNPTTVYQPWYWTPRPSKHITSISLCSSYSSSLRRHFLLQVTFVGVIPWTLHFSVLLPVGPWTLTRPWETSS